MAKDNTNGLYVGKTSAPLILVIGQTGAGKSHFCNKVLGEDVEEVEESPSLSSCTKEPQLVPATVDGNEYLLVDTPGFNDTWKDFKRSDARILGEIAQTLTIQSQLGVQLRGILFLYDITAKRMTGDCQRQFELVQRICGQEAYTNVLLVTTNWPKRYEDQSEQGCFVRERELRREFWQGMIAGGSDMCRFDGQHASAKAIIRKLAGKPNITLALQDELAQGVKLKRTRAFSFIVRLRQRDEAALRVAEAGGGEAPVNAEGLAIRKNSEHRLNDDIVERVRQAIAAEEEAATKERRKLTVKSVFRWLMGLTNLALQAAQVGLST